MRLQLEFLLENNIINENYVLNKDSLYHIPCIDEPIKTNAVFGIDTRTLVPSPSLYPYFPIVRLLLLFPNGIGRATGFLIGANKVVTAGHCIYDSITHEFVEDIVAIAEPGSSNNHYGVCVGFRYSLNYILSHDASNDWAILKLDLPLGNYAGVLPIVDWSTLPPHNIYVGEIPGYPGKAQGKATTLMWTASGTILCSPNQPLLNYTFSTSSGDSGAPVLIQENGLYYVVGIHIIGDSTNRINHARVIDTELFNTFIAF